MPNHEELLEILLKNRGIAKKDWEQFLNPSFEDHLNDPFLLKGMETAVVRFFEAVSNNQKIMIYSDYDADGIPAAVILHDFLKKITQEQDTLDSLSSQIQITTSGDNVSINDLLGANVNIATSDEVDFCAKIINPTLNSSHKIFKVFKVENKKTNKAYEDWLAKQDNKHEEFLIHGTRNANIFPILSSGLILRPTDAYFSGKIYGEGTYFSAHAVKR